ncbi:MAG: nucleotidyl transferase AbiEii/AbiGii toxin family protein [Acidimicrobiia bacterium]|nr:nucleotidyl transferase AbiEii/AbiGii toxin family protein [Acidimicrobiia bacterium]
MSALTDIQRQALEMFFDLDESEGFVIAGGVGLLLTGLTTRPTEDIDLFATGAARTVIAAGDAFEASCTARGWTVDRIQDAESFRRIAIETRGEPLLVDLAIDSAPSDPPTVTVVGPTYAPTELAARKLLALFDRAAARDFVDLHAISERLDLHDVLAAAEVIDEGFDIGVLVEMLAHVDRFDDEELRRLGANPSTLREFTRAWSVELENSA